MKIRKEIVDYTMIHRYIRYTLGRPPNCEKCEKSNNEGGRSLIKWANISKKYLRDLDDWIALCRSCRIKFDETDFSNIQKEK